MIFSNHEIRAQSPATIIGPEKRTLITPRNLLFVLLVIAPVIALRMPLKNLASLSLHNDEYSHTVVIPLMTLALLYLERKKVFRETHYSFALGALVLVGGIALDCVGRECAARLSGGSYLFLRILSLAILWMGGFVLCYGARAFRSAAFPLLFNLLMVPLPGSVMAKPIALVQHGSAEVLNLFYELAGVPFFRDGMNFSLTGFNLQVARQCSGIHSTLALFIASLIGGHFYLKSGRARLLLTLCVIPIVSLTNGFRIFIISQLAVHVDVEIFKGNLHRRGGVLFFLAGLTILACVALLLRSRERAKQRSAKVAGDVDAVAGAVADRR